MSLEEELSKATQVPDPQDALDAHPPFQNYAEMILFVTQEILVPLIGAQRDAILRLAREIDELRSSHG